MTVLIYDTLRSEKKAFVPLNPPQVRIYVCGPTVYDHAHLGHARCYVIYDVLVRHLRARGFEVKYVRNVTDVDDKIAARARELNEEPLRLARRFEEAFQEDMRRLGNLDPTVEPRVSEHIADIIAWIEKLIELGHAYVVDGDVYFHVPSFGEYGKLSKRPAQAIQAGASGRLREEEARKKRHPADFALWKAHPADEWGWPSPWGWGRPGWHIECSVMSAKHAGLPLDLHGGGLDLVFPHHENEIAQSESLMKTELARHWMHNGFVEVNKEKMSKSLGNFFTIRELFGRYDPEVIRYAMLTVHYRSPLNFDVVVSEDGQLLGFPLLDESEKRVEYLYETRQRLQLIPASKLKADGPIPQAISQFPELLAQALDNDLDFPLALARLNDFLKATNDWADQTIRKGGNIATIESIEKGWACLVNEMGIGATPPQEFLLGLRKKRARARGISEEEVEARIQARALACLLYTS
ncbi:MAG: cysteine--tRNA ligase, partial [Deltaproteobacteria bacterium]|nr:cysteine--tRNA ligase [Deltaproteobacteria bacterium]